jgi:hypothetical protein
MVLAGRTHAREVRGVGHREGVSATRLLGVVGMCAAVSACGPAGGDRDLLPIEEGADAVEADADAEDGGGTGDDGAGTDGAGVDGAGDDGAGDDGAGAGQPVIAAPFRVPSPSELTLDGDELTRRIVDACEAAQPSPAPPGPCVEVVIVPRPDPERQPGTWIGTDPAGGQEVPHGATVTLFVADESSPTEEFGTTDTSPPEELGTDERGSDGSDPDERPADDPPAGDPPADDPPADDPPADLGQVDGGDADGGA